VHHDGFAVGRGLEAGNPRQLLRAMASVIASAWRARSKAASSSYCCSDMMSFFRSSIAVTTYEVS
jgi:hypothetical protein